MAMSLTVSAQLRAGVTLLGSCSSSNRFRTLVGTTQALEQQHHHQQHRTLLFPLLLPLGAPAATA